MVSKNVFNLINENIPNKLTLPPCYQNYHLQPPEFQRVISALKPPPKNSELSQ